MFNKEDGVGIVGRNQGEERKGYIFQGEVENLTACLAVGFSKRGGVKKENHFAS